MFLMASTRTGISAKQLEREIGVTYKTAWRMFKQIRQLMVQDGITLFGEIEVDGTYIGGKRPGKRGRGAAGKTIVAGMVERGGQAVVKVVPGREGQDIASHDSGARPGPGRPSTPTRCSATTGFPAWAICTIRSGTRPSSTSPDGVHTNNIEGMWSNVKRGIDGVNHAVSPKYLQGYLDAYVYRFNHRSDSDPMFVQLLGQVASV